MSLDQIRKNLSDLKLDATLITSLYNIIHLTGFSGFSVDEREAYLFITKDTQYIITDSRYREAVKSQVTEFELIEILPTLSHFDVIKKIISQHRIKTLGIEEHDLTVQEYKKLKGTKTTHYSPSREIKDEDEISKIAQACKFGDKVFEYMLKVIKSGKSEKDLAWEMEKFVKEQGAEFSFLPIIAFSEHAARPHHQNTNKQLTADSGQLILMDFGVKVDGYCSDITRVVFLGKALAEQKRVYKTVKEAQQRAIDFLVKNNCKVSGQQVDQIARNYIKSQGYEPYGHGLGHGIGLEVHEAPRLSPKSTDKLQSGMVFSIEPGVYLPGKFGVRLEDLFTVQDNELIQLTHASIKIIEIN